MSPDEALLVACSNAVRIANATPADATPWDVKIALAVIAEVRAHRASGEGGSTSALRASAPEGQDGSRASMAARMRTAYVAASDAGRPQDAWDAASLAALAWVREQEDQAEREAFATAQAQARTPSAASAASAPEEDDARLALRELVACKALKDKLEAVAAAGCEGTTAWHDIRNEYEERKAKAWKQARLVLANPPGVSWHAQSDGANAPSLPEGIDPYVRAIRDAVKCAEAYRESCADAMRLVDDGEILTFLNERSLAAGTIADSIHRLALQSPPPPAASVEAGPSRGADAPLAPEGAEPEGPQG